MQTNSPVGVLSITGPLAMGSCGRDVQTLQAALNQTLLSPGLKPDGAFGYRTDAAVRAFQRWKNLKVDGIVGPCTSAALGLQYKARIMTAPLPLPGPQLPRRPLETPDLPGPPPPNAIERLVDAITRGLADVQKGVLSIISALDNLPDAIAGEIRRLLSGPFQTAMAILRGCVHVASVTLAAAANIMADAIRKSFQNVIGALQSCLAVLSRLPDILGLTRIADQIRSILARLTPIVDRVIDVILRTLRGIGGPVSDAIAALITIVRGAAPV